MYIWDIAREDYLAATKRLKRIQEKLLRFESRFKVITYSTSGRWCNGFRFPRKEKQC